MCWEYVPAMTREKSHKSFMHPTSSALLKETPSGEEGNIVEIVCIGAAHVCDVAYLFYYFELAGCYE